MSGLGISALVLTGVWIGILTLVVLLVVRQIALLTVRLDHVRTGPAFDFGNDGLEVGSQVPEEVTAALPELKTDLTYLLLVSATCNPCRTLVSELQGQGFASERNIIALVPGRDELADGLVTMLPPGIPSIRDPQASALAKSLQIQSTPFALKVEEGIVTRKAYLHSAADLAQLIEGRATSVEGESMRSAKEVVNYVH